jgi:hypothetical protein
MKYFWENGEWLDKIKKIDIDFYNIIKNSRNIDIDWENFTMIIDGLEYKLSLQTIDGRICKHQLFVKK